MKDEQILFTTQTKYTFEEYVRYSDRVSRPVNILSYIIWLGAGLALAWLAFSNKNYRKVLIIVVGCVGLVIRGRMARKRNLENAFHEPDSVADRMLTYHFYSDRFQQICDTVISEPVRYYDLRKMIETKTNFYLIYGEREGCIIVKENCSPGLIQFLKNLKDDPGSPRYNEEKEAELIHNRTTMEIVQSVGCPYEIVNSDMPEESIMKWYEQAVLEAEKEGWPVIVPVNEAILETLQTAEEEGYDRNEMLHTDFKDGRELLEKWYQEIFDDEDELAEYMGEMEGGDEVSRFLTITEFASQYDEFILFRIPVDEPWKVMAYFPMGGWNTCPETKDIMAVCKYWYEKYRAVPAVIGHDTLEFLTGKEVCVERDAWDLAKEHFAFCEDAVFQCTGTSTIGELADSLQKSKIWYFWWD